MTIQKTNHTWIPLLNASEIDGVTTLQDIVIQNVYIRRNDRYHHAKSDLVSSSFDQLNSFSKLIFQRITVTLTAILQIGQWNALSNT